MSGFIYLNGNVEEEKDLFYMLRPEFLRPCDEREGQNNILFVTAAWKKNEGNDAHISYYMNEICPGCDIANLGVYDAFRRLQVDQRKLYNKYHKKQQLITRLKFLYHQENKHDLERLLNIYRLESGVLQALLEKGKKKKGKSGQKFSKSSLNKSAQELLVENIDYDQEKEELYGRIRQRDSHLFAALHDIEGDFLDNQVLTSAYYQEQRELLANKILSADSIVFFGGHTFMLNNRLRFYNLARIFKKALASGANFFGISAGSICMSSDFYMNYDIEESPYYSFLNAEDYGLGLVKSIQVFPHSNDYDYVTAPNDMILDIFSRRIAPILPVFLEIRSVLKFHLEGEMEIFESIGEDPAYIVSEGGELIQATKGLKVIIDPEGSALLC